MIEPARHLAELMAKAGQPAYYYRFSYVPTRLNTVLPGAPHAMEIPFVFDEIAPFLKKTSKADQAMADLISSYWMSFVKTGDPNGGGRPQWNPYNPATEDVMNFTETGTADGPDPFKARLDLWRDVWAQ
jgi:para-nitrobenzyl esterase